MRHAGAARISRQRVYPDTDSRQHFVPLGGGFGSGQHVTRFAKG